MNRRILLVSPDYGVYMGKTEAGYLAFSRGFVAVETSELTVPVFETEIECTNWCSAYFTDGFPPSLQLVPVMTRRRDGFCHAEELAGTIAEGFAAELIMLQKRNTLPAIH